MSPIFQYAADLYRDMRQEWDLLLEAEYAKAEEGSHGAMLNSLGRREAIDPYSLLIGPWSRVVKYATPELVEWFEEHGRPSPAQFEREWFNSWLGEEPPPPPPITGDVPAAHFTVHGDGRISQNIALAGDRTVSNVDLEAARRRFDEARNRHPVEWTGPTLPSSRVVLHWRPEDC